MIPRPTSSRKTPRHLRCGPQWQRGALRLAPLLAALAAITACQTLPGAPVTATAAVTETVPACPAELTVMDGWDLRAPPRRIFGNSWYVGTCGLSAVLVTSDQGHILIDGASQAAGPLILVNIRALGFEPGEVKYLLNSHEHHDHAGGLAYLQQHTGAVLLARAPAVDTLRSGRSTRSDPQFLLPGSAFAPVARVQAIADDHQVQLGPLLLSAHATPGHTPGGTSWSWRSCQQDQCLDLAYTDSVSAISDDHYRYDQHPLMLAAFEQGLETLAALPCDIQIAPHPLASELFARLDGSKPLIDRQACQRYAQTGRDNLRQRLQDEAAGRKP